MVTAVIARQVTWLFKNDAKIGSRRVDHSTTNLPRSIAIWHWKPYSPGLSGVNSKLTCSPSGIWRFD
jgi:hypothetical protein